MANLFNQNLTENNSNRQPSAQPSEMGRMFCYNGNNVTMRSNNGIVYVNLTEVAKAFPEKNLTQIINSQEIKEYCEAISKLQNYSFTDLLIVRKGAPATGGGTWAHQKVALRVAQKLSPEFAVWVDTKIEELLTTGVTTVRNDDEAIAYAMNVLSKRLEQAKRDKENLLRQNAQQQKVIEAKDAQISDMKDKTAYMDIILQSKSTVTVTQIAQDYGMSAIKFNKLLAELRIQRKVNGQWVLYTPFLNKGYVQSTTQSVPTKDGPSISVMNTQWTQNGRLFLYQLLKQKNILPVIEQKITA